MRVLSLSLMLSALVASGCADAAADDELADQEMSSALAVEEPLTELDVAESELAPAPAPVVEVRREVVYRDAPVQPVRQPVIVKKTPREQAIEWGSSGVMVRAPKAKPVVQKTADKGLIITSSQNEAPPASMSLRLEPSKTALRADEEFFVDVVLDNPQQHPLDRFKALIQFDSAYLEVIDYDRGNWIRQGTNIYDGFAHDDFKFHFHRANIADNKHGLIVYDVASEVEPVRLRWPDRLRCRQRSRTGSRFRLGGAE